MISHSGAPCGALNLAPLIPGSQILKSLIPGSETKHPPTPGGDTLRRKEICSKNFLEIRGMDYDRRRSISDYRCSRVLGGDVDGDLAK